MSVLFAVPAATRADRWDEPRLLPGGRVDVRREGAAELVTAREPESLRDHVHRFGPRPSAAGPDGPALITRLADIGLTGRGGGHFPVARKWRSVLEAGGGGTVVANAAEGEPASAKDAVLLQLRPHLLLDGLALAAEATGAESAVIWLHRSAVAVRRALARALAERRAAHLAEAPVRIETAPDHYLAGESSAVVRALSGGPALPEFRTTSAAKAGIGGRPTLVHNAETLCRVAETARWSSPGQLSALLTVVTPIHRAVLELGRDSTFADALVRGGWPAHEPPGAVLLGGYGGAWASWAEAAELPLDEAVLRRQGRSLGAGIVAPIPTAACGVAETAALAGYLADSSARQCGPCMFGLPALALSLRRLAEGSAPARELARLHGDVAAIRGRGACHHPDGATRLVASAAAVFEDDLAEHARGRRCAGSRRGITLPVPLGGEHHG